MTKKNYVAIADIIMLDWKRRNSVNRRPFELENRLADYFQQDNPRFKRKMFLTACGIEKS